MSLPRSRGHVLPPAAPGPNLIRSARLLSSRRTCPQGRVAVDWGPSSHLTSTCRSRPNYLLYQKLGEERGFTRTRGGWHSRGAGSQCLYVIHQVIGVRTWPVPGVARFSTSRACSLPRKSTALTASSMPLARQSTPVACHRSSSPTIIPSKMNPLFLESDGG